ncbi:hypothetical protein SA2016_2867 [Sinomonas atrocyanea]|uniref:GH26 domain-containing protein n=1 Tax=Sinomonas atrocyanea TaxID=37927 RepID=A0A127A780_9MICC|nr:glycosyl hydrolase [Sinomonas atrocyanea]AMM33532.1 hypothetical protein SA2016_2867 [Sinomonas atrocyanea]GEB62972.1 hypothetical protein SAT01_04200 [Sinomonas atrocyanea]GGG61830.1 hypothetical protein GCM10007172_11170 [Sinomonas atrocyanea]
MPPSLPVRLKLAMAALALAAGIIATVAHGQSAPAPPQSSPQTYFGVQLDSARDTVGGYAARLGQAPALYGFYIDFPLQPADKASIDAQAHELAQRRSSLMLTLEPRGGLGAVTPAALAELTRSLQAWNGLGVPVLVRFGQEMNGSWYPWGQRPAEYIEKFRQVAAAVHGSAGSGTIWAPNEGGGYPFEGGAYEAKPGTADFTALDTDKDGRLTQEDDPYSPYWPGDDAVDWVGLSVYHFGTAYPWGKNTVPEPGKLIGKITGTYRSASVDETAVPDFYSLYADGHSKPFAICETGAFYNLSHPDGASALSIKKAWWDQLFEPQLRARFPRLRLAVWFEWIKQENQPGNPTVDWAATEDGATGQAFRSALPSSFGMAPVPSAPEAAFARPGP